MKATLTEENYLKALFHLVDHENKVTINELSKFLNVKMPSVNNMMKKFAEKDWVVYETYKPLRVTNTGKREAALVVRKHRLTEMFLVKKMNFGWENVHEIAEQLEHVHSPIFFDKMDEILNYPKFDPHGEPIPDKDGNIIAQDLHKLSSCQEGETVIFASVTLSDDAFLNYLNERKLLLNTKIKINKIEEFDKSVTIEIEGKKEILSKKATEKILVKR
ncbi:metal-dependent transcriptional regulator [Chryseobacterium sp. CT-SW4]|uniref:metal-dependent transcriptional regulator n=1 Tax=Chryseobacterium sp. SW-1 TaxID=3157343 RepID=UPI003B0175AC